jgi:hypothetical protein
LKTRKRLRPSAPAPYPGAYRFAPDPIFDFRKKRKKISPSSFLSVFRALDLSHRSKPALQSIQKTIRKLSAANIETIEQLAAALSIQQRVVF